MLFTYGISCNLYEKKSTCTRSHLANCHLAETHFCGFVGLSTGYDNISEKLKQCLNMTLGFKKT